MTGASTKRAAAVADGVDGRTTSGHDDAIDAPWRARPCLKLIAVAIALPLIVTACGKRGALEPPEGAELYRQSYPAPETVTPPEDPQEQP